jgi:hypothetical protein
LRDAAIMGRRLGTRALRIAVKDVVTNRRMVAIIRHALAEAAAGPVAEAFES